MVAPDKNMQKALTQSLSTLKESVDSISNAVKRHEPVHKNWNQNPLFEEKLKLHKQLNALVSQQKELAEGIVELLHMVHDFEHEKLRKKANPIPKAPRPSAAIRGNK